ncbi:MAG: thioredoxin family protein [Acidobacteria bacterium]|nr:thioredoxin family protein [Acidobacteriota bacterium]
MNRVKAVGMTLALVAAAAGLGLLGACGSQSVGQGTAPGGDIQVVSKGEPLNLRDYLVTGKYTLFDYYADWCPPCRRLSPRLEELARQHANLALRKVDIVSWSHPVARQQGVTDLPYLRLFDPEGRLVAEGDAVLDSLKQLFGLTDPPEVM